MNWVLQNFLGAAVLVIIILFQPELRRALANVGRAPLLRFFDPIKEERILQECVRGTQALAGKRIGALIALQRDTDLKNYVEGGVLFDARVSRELLFSIFLPGLPGPRRRRADPGQPPHPGRLLPPASRRTRTSPRSWARGTAPPSGSRRRPTPW